MRKLFNLLRHKSQRLIFKIRGSVLAKRVLITVYCIFFLSILYHVVYARRIIPGVYIGGVDIGGKTFDTAVKLLETQENKTDKVLTLRFSGKDYYIDSKEIGLTYSWGAAVSRAYEVGRTGNVIWDTKDKLAGLFKRLYIPAFYDYEDNILAANLEMIRGDINKSAIDAYIKLDNNSVLLMPESSGLKVQDAALFAVVVKSFDDLNFSSKDIPVVRSEPKVTEVAARKFLPEIEKVLQNTITIKARDKMWVLRKDDIANLIGFRKATDSGNVELSLNRPSYEALVDSIAQEVNKLPRGAVTKTQGNTVVAFEITEKGSELAKSVFEESLKDAIFNKKTGIELTFNEVGAPSDKNKYGILSLLGTGTSTYVGSSAARIHNLTLAASRTNGVLVAPNQIYSLNSSIGEISGRTGYNAALIISNGRTVLGEGGGVCQVSTTMFRAALNTGLPIVMRFPHAYRVHYYEEDTKPGFDASIFQPTLDFQFKNDTPNYILIQTENDPANLKLTFKIYGTPDGRSVELSEPVITNQSPPPAALYIDDPTLAKGVVRQVDWSAWGANVTFTRTVKRDDKVILTDTFSSRYQPWRAIFMKGTKE